MKDAGDKISPCSLFSLRGFFFYGLWSTESSTHTGRGKASRTRFTAIGGLGLLSLRLADPSAPLLLCCSVMKIIRCCIPPEVGHAHGQGASKNTRGGGPSRVFLLCGSKQSLTDFKRECGLSLLQCGDFLQAQLLEGFHRAVTLGDFLVECRAILFAHAI